VCVWDGSVKSVEAPAETGTPQVGIAGRKAWTQRFLPLDALRGWIMILPVSDGLGFRVFLDHPP
jgi:hypothetical protein